MGDKVDAKIIKRTQDSLGKIIKKPPLTEKLLNKPPFRFLHDVMTSVIKSTGFMKGLFTESEMVSENVKERDSKVAFLQKVIDMVSLVLGKTISAKPSKIVAGQEADRTNELLHALAEAVNKKVNNDEYVQRVLKPESGSSKKQEKDSDRKKKEKSKSRDKEKEGSRDQREKDSEHRSRDRRDRDSEQRSRDRRDRDSEHRSRDRRDREPRESREQSREEESNRKKDSDRKKRHEGKDGDHGNQDTQEEPPQRIPRPSSAKGSRRRHGHEDDSTDGEEEHVRQRERERSSKSRDRDGGGVGEDDLPPQVAAARKMQRPSSARPAPPKVKKNEAQDEPVMMGTSNVPNLITDKDDSDDDGFMAKEEEEAEPVPVPQRAPETEEDGEHGGLVKKILETKKGLEGNQQAGRKTEIERSHASDATRRKEREMIQKEIDRLRTSIQTLTRSVNPLGKILDFLQEDLDSMQKELTVWQAENKDNAVALQRESSITETSIEPLKAQLQELDAAIGDQLDLIAAVKHNTLKNNDKIEKMLSTVTKS